MSSIKKKHQKQEQAENWKWLRYIRGSFSLTIEENCHSLRNKIVSGIKRIVFSK